MSDNSTPSPIPQPGQAQRYFGEKIVTGDYKRCLVIMVEEDGSHQIWNATNIWSDAAGLVAFANLHLENAFDGSNQEKIGDDEPPKDSPPEV